MYFPHQTHLYFMVHCILKYLLATLEYPLADNFLSKPLIFVVLIVKLKLIDYNFGSFEEHKNTVREEKKKKKKI